MPRFRCHKTNVVNCKISHGKFGFFSYFTVILRTPPVLVFYQYFTCFASNLHILTILYLYLTYFTDIFYEDLQRLTETGLDMILFCV